MLHLHDTALGRVVPFEPRTPGEVSLYLCGPTVYDVPHLGHGRHALVWDVLRRYLEWSGLTVRFVSNVTDIDDNIIKRANEQGRSTEEVVEQYERIWWESMDALGVLRPTDDPHATGYVEEMVALVQRLVDDGIAYETSDGVYFHAERIESYGLLARQPLDSLRAGAGDRAVVGEGEKLSPLDFVLWKKSKPGEPSWPSPWGAGRPGWHTECVVMSLDILGDGFDIHAGGQDLAFPHHENERAQACALGRTFARHWVHHGWVMSGGEKMSKSLDNFTSLTDLLERTDPRAYRLLVLRSHYRAPMDVTPETTADAERQLDRLDTFARRFVDAAARSERDEAVTERFRAAMDDDLNTPTALAVLFEALRDANAAADANHTSRAETLAATVLDLAAALGLSPRAGSVAAVGDEVADLVTRRDQARAAKDWAASDALRDELQALGYVVEDTAAGTTIRPA